MAAIRVRAALKNIAGRAHSCGRCGYFSASCVGWMALYPSTTSQGWMRTASSTLREARLCRWRYPDRGVLLGLGVAQLA